MRDAPASCEGEIEGVQTIITDHQRAFSWYHVYVIGGGKSTEVAEVVRRDGIASASPSRIIISQQARAQPDSKDT